MSPAFPRFDGVSISEVRDLHGAFHVLATAQDGAVWHFREPTADSAGHWLVEPLAGRATSRPSVVLSETGLLHLWITGPEHTVWSSAQNPGASGWSGWVRLETPPALDVTAAAHPRGGTLLVWRGVDGGLEVGVERSPGAAIESWQRIFSQAASRPLVLGTEKGGVELLFVGRDGSLVSAAQAGGAKDFAVQSLPGPKLQGELSAAVTLDGTVVVVARGTNGELLSIQKTKKGWSEGAPLAVATSGRFGDPQLLSLDGKAIDAIAEGPGKTFWINRMVKGRWEDWRDTRLAVAGSAAPAMSVGGRRLHVDSKFLESLAAALAHLQLRGFYISIDRVSPSPTVEDDALEIHYTIRNDTSEAGIGQVTATWDGATFSPVAPRFAPPLAPGQMFQGTFVSDISVPITGGTHRLQVVYKASTHQLVQIPEYGDVVLENVTQFAQRIQDVHVLAFSDPFPTDDPVVAAGPYACLEMTPAQQHACGLGTCSEGNTPQTCPQDCPSPPSVQSYNSEELCRQMKVVQAPKSIADLQAYLKRTKEGHRRVRVLGAQHTSNAQICTDGDALSTENLRAAAPVKFPTRIGGCQRYDCNANLSVPNPVLEPFQGMQTVRVGPGQDLFDLLEFLDKKNFSLGFAVPGFRKATVGGAIATGTHGSSPIHPSVLSTRVVWMQVVTPDGTLEEHSEKTTPTSLWNALRASVGYLGVVVQVRLAVEPSFALRAKTHWQNAKDLLAKGAPQSLVAHCDFGEMVWFPHRGDDEAHVLVICETKTNDSGDGGITILDPPESEDASKALPVLDYLESEACGAESVCDVETLRAIALRYYHPPFAGTECPLGLPKVLQNTPDQILESQGASKPGLAAAIGGGSFFLGDPFGGLMIPWLGKIFEDQVSNCDVDVTGRGHRMMASNFTPPDKRPFERDWELFVPGDRAQDAIRIAKDHFRQNAMCLPLIGVFLRFAPAEAGTLIAHTVNEGPFGATSLPGMFFEMPVFLPKGMKCSAQARYEKVYADLAEKLVRQIGARAHWGKNRRSLFQVQRQVATYGDNMRQFRQLVKERDPTGVFANQFGVDIGLRWPQLPSTVPPDTDALGCAADDGNCGAANFACCQPGGTCQPGLVCRAGFCLVDSRTSCAICQQHETQCLAACGGDPFCTCTCSNELCECSQTRCDGKCVLKTCSG